MLTREQVEQWRDEMLDQIPRRFLYDENAESVKEANALCDLAIRALARPGAEESPTAWIEHHKGGDNLTWARVDHPYAKATPLYRLKDSAATKED